MPDHYRTQKDAMGPPNSPGGFDSPLALVIYKKGDHLPPHVNHDQHTLTISHEQMPGSPGRSSGFSETGEGPSHDVIMGSHEENPDGGNLVVAMEEEVVEQEVDDEPLSLVVDKSDDSGHGHDERSDFFRREMNCHQDGHGIKVKDFARFNMESAEIVKISPEVIRHEQYDRAGILAPRRSKISESESDISSEDSWEMDSDGKTFLCKICDKSFTNRHHLSSHLITHTGERNFTCKTCGKTFGRKSTLRAHMITHTGSSNFMCPLCDKACNDTNSLEEHVRMHTGEKPFVCTICSKAYARKSHLNVHYRVHTGERPFICSECGKDFTEKRFLNDHVQTAHSGQDGPLKCPNCFREFAYKTSLKQHLKKQMCVKNINRGLCPTGAGSHAKQFACPFCDKSYSWKQTLKQHVSMYHRNKVHTDEFWKYELSKHRRTVVDNETNEDLWLKQLGKHAQEDSPRQESNRGSLLYELDPNHEDRWLEQIKRPTENADVKMLALRSLRSSLQLMSSGFRTEQHEPHPTREDGYLSLLANVSYSKLSEQAANNDVNHSGSPSKMETDDHWDSLKDIKEESSVKRTQLWLAQLRHYPQKDLHREEMERGQEGLWESRLTREKVRSDPVEVNLESENEDALHSHHRSKPIMPLMMSALQLHPPPRVISPMSSTGQSPPRLTLTLHSSDGDSEGSSPRKVPAFFSDDTNNNNNNNNMPPTRHVPLAPPPMPHERSLPIMIPKTAAKPDDLPQSKSPPQDSVLKSLLMDPIARRRPSTPPPTAAPPKIRPAAEETSDILLRRLLGIRDPEPQIPAPKFGPPSATITSPEVEENSKALPERSQASDALKDSYKKTSVLKHLLYRYNHSSQLELNKNC